jgi:hypothetical protein
VLKDQRSAALFAPALARSAPTTDVYSASAEGVNEQHLRVVAAAEESTAVLVDGDSSNLEEKRFANKQGTQRQGAYVVHDMKSSKKAFGVRMVR